MGVGGRVVVTGLPRTGSRSMSCDWARGREIGQDVSSLLSEREIGRFLDEYWAEAQQRRLPAAHPNLMLGRVSVADVVIQNTLDGHGLSIVSETLRTQIDGDLLDTKWMYGATAQAALDEVRHHIQSREIDLEVARQAVDILAARADELIAGGMAALDQL